MTSVGGVRRPFVTIIVPMRNEAASIGRCLESLLAGDYPADRYEVLVADGASEDGSAAIVRGHGAGPPSVRLIANPRRNQAAGLNRALEEARGEIVVRADAHTEYAPDYVSRCVELLERTDAANVGGPQRAVGDSYLGRAIAAATTSPFGAGGARFRVSRRAAWVDTVYLGAWRRETLVALGAFDEAAPPNEDDELNVRLRAWGGRVLLDPRIGSAYHVRGSLGALARQYFRYGRARVRTVRLHPRSVRPRQLAPPALLAGLAASAVLATRSTRGALVLPAAYAAATVAGSVDAARRGGWRHLPALPVVFWTLHLSWGAGFLAGVARHGLPGIGGAPALAGTRARYPQAATD